MLPDKVIDLEFIPKELFPHELEFRFHTIPDLKQIYEDHECSYNTTVYCKTSAHICIFPPTEEAEDFDQQEIFNQVINF